MKITAVEDVNYEHLTFLTTYIIPLICFNLTSTKYIIALAILLLVIGIIYVRTDKFYTNPTLAVLGYKIYKVDAESRTGKRQGIILITREDISVGDQVNYKEVDKKVYFAGKTK